MDAAAQLEALLDLESRHEDLLERLDELDRRVESVLAECMKGRQQPGENGEHVSLVTASSEPENVTA